MARRGANLVFDGENMLFDEFYNAFGYDAVMYMWDEAQQARAIMFCFAGKAKEKYQSLSIEAKNDIKEIFKALKEISVKPASHYLSMFNAKTMRPGEKLLELLLDRAMP